MWNPFGGKAKSNLPEPTALETQRAKQIELLRAFNQNVTELQRDVEYRVNTDVNGVSLALNITLPPRFPNDKPVVKVSPPAQHAWIGDQNMVVGCPGLNNFMVHSDLGKVISDIVEEFKRNPPKVLDAQSHAHAQRYAPYPAMSYPGVTNPTQYPAGFNPTLAGSSNSNNQFVPTLHAPTLPASTSSAPTFGHSLFNGTNMPQLPPGPPGTYRLPEIPAALPNLKDKSKEELQELLENEDKLIVFLSDLPQVQQISRDRAALSDFNEKAASVYFMFVEDNLSKRPVLEERKRLLLEKYDHLNDLRQKFDQSSARQDLLRNQFSTQALEDNLKVAAHQAEEQAEHIAEKFLNGNIGVDDFNKEYLEKRKLAHLRRVKEEKISTGLVVQPAFQ